LEIDFSKVAPESLFILSENLAVIFRGISPAVSQVESRQNHQRGRKMTRIGAKWVSRSLGCTIHMDLYIGDKFRWWLTFLGLLTLTIDLWAVDSNLRSRIKGMHMNFSGVWPSRIFPILLKHEEQGTTASYGHPFCSRHTTPKLILCFFRHSETSTVTFKTSTQQ